MSPIIKRKGEKFTLPGKYLLFILTILCIGLIVLTFNTNLLSAPVSAVGGFLITPLQNGISKAGSLISSRTEELVQIRSLLKENEELKAQIDDFRKRNFEFQQSTDSNFSKLDSFEREYETFRENPMVSDFLAAELAFCRLMQRLNTRITAELRFE